MKSETIPSCLQIGFPQVRRLGASKFLRRVGSAGSARLGARARGFE